MPSHCSNELVEKVISNFLNTYHFKNTIKQKYCLKLVVTVLKLYFLKKKPNFKPSENIKDSKMIYLDKNLIINYQNFT